MNGPVQVWLDALRSGKFKQGRTFLHYGEEFCCLGVACEKYQEIVGDLDVEIEGNGIVTYDGERYSLPKKVMDWLGVSDHAGSCLVPVITGGKEKSDLAKENDIRDRSFRQIADLIESEPEGMFKKEEVLV